jgi:hypothetical protein
MSTCYPHCRFDVCQWHRFLITYSRKIRFGTIEAIRSRKSDVLFNSLKSVAQLYSQLVFWLLMP